MKNVICLVIAVILLAVSALIMYPGYLNDVTDEQIVADTLAPVIMSNFDTFKVSLGFENVPFYGSETKPGVAAALATFVPYLKGETDELPAVGEELGKIYKEDESFTNTLLAFILLAVLSIPVYMILRIIPYNTLYKAADTSFLLARPFTRGFAACACSVTSISFTWLIYHTLIYKKLYSAVTNWFSNVEKPEIALTATNVIIIIVAIIVIIALLKSTLFRGSVLKSVLLALLRMALFVVVFAAANVLIGCATWRVLIFVLAMIAVVGIVDSIVDPTHAKKEKA